MKNFSKIFLLLIVCILACVTMTACNLFNDTPTKGQLILTSEKNTYFVNEIFALNIQWSNGDSALGATIKIEPIKSGLFMLYENSQFSITDAGVYTITATSVNKTSEPLTITIIHSPQSLQKHFDKKFQPVFSIGREYDLEMQNMQQVNVHLEPTDLVTLTNNTLIFHGIGTANITIDYADGDVHLSYTISSLNTFTSSVLDELKRTNTISQDATQATIDDFAKAKELNLTSKLYHLPNEIYLLKNFISLEKLQIADCNLISLSFLNTPNLKSLDASGNLLTDISPLAQCTALMSLDISNNIIDDITALKNLSSLTRLKIGGNPIKNIEDISQTLTPDGLDTTTYSLYHHETLTGTDLQNLATFTSLQPYLQEHTALHQSNIQLDFSSKSQSGIITILPSVQCMEILSSPQITHAISINIQSRSTPLTLIIKNLKINAQETKPAIFSSDNGYIKMIYKGQNTIRGGKGFPAIKVGFIEFVGTKENAQNNSLSLYGGAGLDGSDSGKFSSQNPNEGRGVMGGKGGSGLVTTTANGLVIRRALGLTFQGGNGGKGGQGAKYSTTSFDPNKLISKNGPGGTGGNGGDGYTGIENYFIIDCQERPTFNGGYGGSGGEGGPSLDPKFRGDVGASGSRGEPVNIS